MLGSERRTRASRAHFCRQDWHVDRKSHGLSSVLHPGLSLCFSFSSIKIPFFPNPKSYPFQKRIFPHSLVLFFSLFFFSFFSFFSFSSFIFSSLRCGVENPPLPWSDFCQGVGYKLTNETFTRLDDTGTPMHAVNDGEVVFNSEAARNFFMCLALCHTVRVEEEAEAPAAGGVAVTRQ